MLGIFSTIFTNLMAAFNSEMAHSRFVGRRDLVSMVEVAARRAPNLQDDGRPSLGRSTSLTLT